MTMVTFMRTARRFFLLLVLVTASLSAFAGTYYIDCVNGSDSANGTSTTTPWKHDPYMTGFTGSYSHKAGDQHIFRGGITCPASYLPLAPSVSGASGSQDYYGVLTSWYTGTNSGKVNTSGTTVQWASGNAFQMNGSWAGGAITINGTSYTIASVTSPYQLTLTSSAGTQTAVAYSNSLFVRPILQGSDSATNGISTGSGVSYVTFDSIEISGVVVTTNTSSTGSVLIGGATNGNITLENMDIHNWFLGSGMTDNSGDGGGIYAAVYGGLSPVNMILENSNVGDPENGGNIGACTRGIQTIANNYLHDCSQACLHGCSLVHDNVVNNVGNTFDGTTHTNGFYSDCFDQACSSGLTTATAYIYNNYIMNMQENSGATAIYPNPGTAGVSGTVTYYIFNNVVSSSGTGAVSQIADEIDPYDASSGLTSVVHDWNNTYQVIAGGTCVNVVSRSPALTSVDVKNLHCISTSGTATNLSAAGSNTSSNILLQSVATANGQGYAAPNWMPTSSTASTVGAGTNLTANCSSTLSGECTSTSLGATLVGGARPASGNWDEGSYLYSALGSQPAPPAAPPAPTNVAAAIVQ